MYHNMCKHMGSKGLAPYYRNYMFDAVKNYIFKILPD